MSGFPGSERWPRDAGSSCLSVPALTHPGLQAAPRTRTASTKMGSSAINTMDNVTNAIPVSNNYYHFCAVHHSNSILQPAVIFTRQVLSILHFILIDKYNVHILTGIWFCCNLTLLSVCPAWKEAFGCWPDSTKSLCKKTCGICKRTWRWTPGNFCTFFGRLYQIIMFVWWRFILW